MNNHLTSFDGLSKAGRIGAARVVLGLALTSGLLLICIGIGGRPLLQFAALGLLSVLAAVGGFALLLAGIREHRENAAGAPSGHLASFAANLEDGLLLTGPDGAVAFSNQAFWRLLGYRGSAPAVFHPATHLAPLRGSGEAVYRLAKAAATRMDWEEVIEQSAGGADQSGRWLRLAVEHRQDGTPADFVAWRLSDVTVEHLRQNETLQRVRRSLDQLDLLPAGIFVCGADGSKVTYLNAALGDLLRLDRSAPEIESLTLGHLLAPDGMARLTVWLGEAVRQDVTAIDTELQRRDGTRTPVRVILRAQPGLRQPQLGIVLNRGPVDLSDDGSPAAEARFTRLFHAAPIAIATVDGQGRISSGNPAFAQMFFGVSNGPAITGLSLLERLSPDSQIVVGAALLSGAKSERPLRPIEISLGDKTRTSGQLFLSPNTAGDAEPDSVILYALDTTERKDLEAQFAQSQKMQAIGQLAGGIAHDINNVLTVIIGFSDLLLANSAGDPAFHDLNEIKANANRAANLVRQLLAFSRRQTLRPEILSLNEVISDLSVFLKRSLGEKVKLERDYGRDLWLVKADQTELSRVFVNLAVNAVDAMPNGGTLTISTANVSREECVKLSATGLIAGDYVECRVSDTGHGMTPDIVEKIFEPFFTTKEIGKGTGLGLSTVYGIVKQTGGYIYCDSAPGVGTTFRIFLPRHAAGQPAIEAGAKSEKKDKPRDLTGTGTVLLVEDEESVRRFAARALRRQGYAVLEAGNGQEALEIRASHESAIDLVVSDIVMPEMDGPTLLKELRKTNPELRIIFMSGYADDALSSLDSGEEFAFLSKPFQLTDLVSAVKQLMPKV